MITSHNNVTGIDSSGSDKKDSVLSRKPLKLCLLVLLSAIPVISAFVIIAILIHDTNVIAAQYTSAVTSYLNSDINTGQIQQVQTQMYILFIIVSILNLFIAVTVNLFVVRKYISSPLRTVAKSLSEIKSEKKISAKLMLDTTPLFCHLWDKDFNLIDCNEAAMSFFGFSNKQEYIKRYFDLSPDRQSNGQFSSDKMKEHLKKAFDTGYDIFEWTHQTLKGDRLPSETTFVRVDGEDGSSLVVGHTSDLRRMDDISSRVEHLEQVADKIYYDPLTGIHNRRFFDETTEATIKVLSRSGGKVSLLMIDIDNFKLYNDTYGHVKGDECLKAIAEAISSIITRADDFVTRYGGEEFTIVLPNTNESGARFIAHKVLESVRNLKIPHENSTADEHVTVSVGITTGSASHTQTTSDYVRRADEMLYRAKQNGRNRYVYGSLGL